MAVRAITRGEALVVRVGAEPGVERGSSVGLIEVSCTTSATLVWFETVWFEVVVLSFFLKTSYFGVVVLAQCSFFVWFRDTMITGAG